MQSSHSRADIVWNQEIWQKTEQLTSPRVNDRENALDYLLKKDLPRKSPLIAYLIASRISDPDPEFRFHCVQALGSILNKNNSGSYPSDQVLSFVQAYLSHISRDQILNLLDVADRYLAAEVSLLEIFKLCSYAGKVLSGIVNDRNIPLAIRRKAIFFCGEAGFLETTVALQRLIIRYQKSKKRQVKGLRKKITDEIKLYPHAAAALAKLDPDNAVLREIND